MKKLNSQQIIDLHEMLINNTGGAHGVRDIGLLESAASAPFTGFGDFNLYPTPESKASRLAFGIIKNHPFLDGNERTGLLAMLVFLEINGIELLFTSDELVEIGLDLANGKMSEKTLLTWIISHN